MICTFFSAIARMNPMEYVVGTMTGHLEKVYFDIDPKGDIRIKKNVMKSPNGSSKYGIHGLVASQNGAFLLIAYYARRVSFVICTLALYALS